MFFDGFNQIQSSMRSYQSLTSFQKNRLMKKKCLDWLYSGFLIILFVLLGNCQFIALRVYPPIPKKTFNEYQPKVKIQWVDKSPNKNYMGVHDPFFFPKRKLVNEYGDLVYILNHEIRNHPEKYRTLHNLDTVKITIQEFDLSTHDSCWSNITNIRMVVNLESPGDTVSREFTYRDEIESHVTDCFLVGSTITLLPLIVYTPYVGYRGNREDQLNQLGRNAIGEFLRFLESMNPKPTKFEDTRQ